MTIIIFFIIGLITGFFLNICIHGLIRKESARFSFRYPVVEIMTGVIYAVTAYIIGYSPDLWITLLFFSCLLVIAFVDLYTMEIPFCLQVILFVIAIVNLLFVNTPGLTWKDAVLGVLVSSGFLLLLYLLGFFIFYKEVIGMGDIKLFVPIGLYLGMEQTLLCMYLSVIIGGLAGGCLLMKRKTKHSMMPFGPCIVSGTMAAVLCGKHLLDLYYGYMFVA